MNSRKIAFPVIAYRARNQRIETLDYVGPIVQPPAICDESRCVWNGIADILMASGAGLWNGHALRIRM